MANAGVVTAKVYATSEEDVNILKKGVTVLSLRGHRPDAIWTFFLEIKSIMNLIFHSGLNDETFNICLKNYF